MYKITYGDLQLGRGGEEVVRDYVTHSDFHQPAPGIEQRLDRLVLLVGRLSDKLGVNLLEVIDKYDLQETYTHVRDEQ
jgi:hypothetical protein